MVKIPNSLYAFFLPKKIRIGTRCFDGKNKFDRIVPKAFYLYYIGWDIKKLIFLHLYKLIGLAA